jgi:hypothetical protein
LSSVRKRQNIEKIIDQQKVKIPRKIWFSLQKTKSMADLFGGPTPPKLKAITINGSVHVESDQDAKNREERRKQRKSRWDSSQKNSNTSKKSSSSSTPSLFEASTPILSLPSPGSAVRDNPEALRAQRMLMPTSIDTSKMDENQQKIYILQMEIHESTRNLARPDLGIPPNPKDRSPSPEPIYNNAGLRINRRIDRVKQRLISQRNNAITRLKDVDPTYQPPSNYRYRNANLEDKVLIPADVSFLKQDLLCKCIYSNFAHSSD